MTSQRDIMECFPYEEARPVQVELLRQLQDNWDTADVFVINAPTALGKSAIARTILSWQYSSSYLVPTNQLLDQFLDAFPGTDTLRRMDAYKCEKDFVKYNLGCGEIKREMGKCCKQCPLMSAYQKAKYHKGPGAYNFHTYMTHQIYRDVLIVDEAHTLIPMIQSMAAAKIWKHKEHYPDDWFKQGYRPLYEWIHNLPAKHHRKKWYKYTINALADPDHPQHVISEEIEDWTGGGYQDIPRGTPVELPLLSIKPVDIRDLKETKFMLPSLTKKIILMSATIGPQDIEQLGLARKRVLYLNCQSPIGADNRPIYPIPIAAANYNNLESATKVMADYIREVLCPKHEGQKGIIHATYKQADILRKYLRSTSGELELGRFLFHTRDNKSRILREFLDSPPERGSILVASGMYEGVDLPYDLARWQVITKIPWLSLADPAIKYKASQNENWYLWETLKKVIQACGRVVRTPTDMGDTYILDASFYSLYHNSRHMLPQWYKDAIRCDDLT